MQLPHLAIGSPPDLPRRRITGLSFGREVGVRMMNRLRALPGWNRGYRRFVACLFLVGLIGGTLFLFLEDKVLRSRWLMANRFQPGKEFVYLRPVKGMDLASQSGIGWDKNGRSYALIDQFHIVANHNAIPDALYFRTCDGQILLRKVSEVITLRWETKERAHMRLWRLDEVLPASVIPLPMWDKPYMDMPNAQFLVLGAGGCVGALGKGTGGRTTLNDQSYPALITQVHPHRLGNLPINYGDSGSPVVMCHEGRWYLYAISHSVYSHKWVGGGLRALYSMHTPLSVYASKIHEISTHWDKYFRSQQKLRMDPEWRTILELSSTLNASQ